MATPKTQQKPARRKARKPQITLDTLTERDIKAAGMQDSFVHRYMRLDAKTRAKVDGLAKAGSATDAERQEIIDLVCSGREPRESPQLKIRIQSERDELFNGMAIVRMVREALENTDDDSTNFQNALDVAYAILDGVAGRLETIDRRGGAS